MIHVDASRTAGFLCGTGVTNGATATAMIDRLGYDYCSIDLLMGTVNVTSNIPSVMKITEGDTTSITSASAITRLTGGTASGNFTIPPSAFTAATSGTNIYHIGVDCKARKRYLFLSVSPVTTQEIVAIARLAEARETPYAVGTQQFQTNTLLSVEA